MPDNQDLRKVTYAAALELWRTQWKRDPARKPNASTYGLSQSEAAEVEHDGYEGLDL